MRAMQLVDIGKLEMVDLPKPVIEKENQVLLRIKYMGVCGSDVHYFKDGCIGSAKITFPSVVGHECSAIVEEVGSAVTKVKPGDEVAIEPATYCWDCEQCNAKRPNTCLNLHFLGTPPDWGCMQEFLVMEEQCCLPTNKKISLQQACISEPFTIGVYTAKQGSVREGSTVGVLGSGPIGICSAEAARAYGAKTIYMTDKLDYRADMAAKHCADWAGNPDTSDIVGDILKQEPSGLDVILECAGDQAAIDQGIELLKPGGTIAIAGIPREDRISFKIDQIRRKEITIVNIRRQKYMGEESVELMGSGKVNIDYMVTHNFPLEQSQKAFETVAGYNDGVVKAVIEF